MIFRHPNCHHTYPKTESLRCSLAFSHNSYSYPLILLVLYVSGQPLIMFEPDPCKDTRRWVHFTSSGNLSSINSDKRVLLGGNTSDRYDGVLCDMQGERVLWQAPRGLWFNANLYQGGLLTRTVYPERCSDQQVPGLVADVANLLPVHLDWLLFPISDVQDSYQHLKYACVTEGSGAHMWMRARDVEPVPNNEDCHVRLERTILGWQWKAVDVDASHIIVGVFFVPPHMDHIPRHVFDSREHWASKVESRQARECWKPWSSAGSCISPAPGEPFPAIFSSVADAPRSFADASAQTTTAPTVQTDAHTQTASEHRLGLLTIHGARCSTWGIRALSCATMVPWPEWIATQGRLVFGVEPIRRDSRFQGGGGSRGVLRCADSQSYLLGPTLNCKCQH